MFRLDLTQTHDSHTRSVITVITESDVMGNGTAAHVSVCLDTMVNLPIQSL